MKDIKRLLTALLLVAAPFAATAQSTDSVDVRDYDVSLDFSSGLPYRGHAVVSLSLLRPCQSIGLELIGTVDSVFVDGQRLATPNISEIPAADRPAGQEFEVEVYYRLNGYVESSGWGGLHVESGMTYNLGVGFGINPHCVGRAVFPCRDSFTDKATYTLRITAKENWSAECSGVLQSRTMDANQMEHSVWRIDQPVCTYLVGISQAPFSRLDTTAGGYPLTIGYTDAQNINTVRRVFALLDTVVPMFERCFGPYRWHRIGYIPTSRGSMEHVNNIALAYQAMASMSDEGQSTIAHELGHAWFGNLVTCQTEGDMWINEGGATFCSEVAREATHGRGSSNALYQKNLESVVRTTHRTDGNQYRPLHDMPHGYTYGSTTYDKGALVWHSLRGLMGDSLFYASMRTLFSRCAFGNLDAYALRDSLMAYSGMDLTDFFRQHVFRPGFVDYHAELVRGDNPQRVMVRLRQQGIGTDSLVSTARLPLTFVSYEREELIRWIDAQFTDDVAEVWVDLPWEPSYCVLDLECAVSDAATVVHINTTPDRTYAYDAVHATVRAGDESQPLNLHIEHHFGHPYDTDTIAGIVRTVNRYWVVNGDRWTAENIECRFRFVRANNTSSDYAYLDPDFYQRTPTYDSIALLWRPNTEHPWRVMTRTKSGNRDEGFLRMRNLRCGEYTIAVVDSNLLSIEDAESSDPKICLFPNPVPQGAGIGLDVPTEQPFKVEIFDTAGRRVWSASGCRSGQTIRPNLVAGTYLVRIENNFISLHSNLIQL